MLRGRGHDRRFATGLFGRRGHQLCRRSQFGGGGGHGAERVGDRLVERPDETLDRRLTLFFPGLIRLLLGCESVCLDHVLFEYFDGARHVADLVGTIGALQLGREVVISQPAHRRRQSADRRADPQLHDHETGPRDRQRKQQHDPVQDQAAGGSHRLARGMIDHLGQGRVDHVDAVAERGGGELLQFDNRNVGLLPGAQGLDDLLFPGHQRCRAGVFGSGDCVGDGGRRVGPPGGVDDLVPSLRCPPAVLRGVDNIGGAPGLACGGGVFDPHRHQAAIVAGRPGGLLDHQQLVEHRIDQLGRRFELADQREKRIQIGLCRLAVIRCDARVARRLRLVHGRVGLGPIDRQCFVGRDKFGDGRAKSRLRRSGEPLDRSAITVL